MQLRAGESAAHLSHADFCQVYATLRKSMAVVVQVTAGGSICPAGESMLFLPEPYSCISRAWTAGNWAMLVLINTASCIRTCKHGVFSVAVLALPAGHRYSTSDGHPLSWSVCHAEAATQWMHPQRHVGGGLQAGSAHRHADFTSQRYGRQPCDTTWTLSPLPRGTFSASPRGHNPSAPSQAVSTDRCLNGDHYMNSKPHGKVGSRSVGVV